MQRSTVTRSTQQQRRGHHEHERDHEHAVTAAQGIEWEDDMVEVNRMTTPANMRWKLVDRDDGRGERTRSTGASASATG